MTTSVVSDETVVASRSTQPLRVSSAADMAAELGEDVAEAAEVKSTAGWRGLPEKATPAVGIL